MADQKLKIIYDAIDSRNYKSALKLLNGLTQKQTKQQQLVQALRALTLERLGKKEEAVVICKSLIGENPTENTVLETLVIVLKALGQLKDIVTLYENASKLNPKNENLLMGVFFSYTRILDFQSQNRVALSLWKQYNKEKYLCWVVESILLQVESTGMVKLLDLAEKMFSDKLIAENKVADQETLELYFTVLLKQQNYSKIIDILKNGKLGELYKIPHLKLQYLAETYAQSNQIKESFEVYKDLLANHSNDDWDYWIKYIDSGFIIEGNSFGENANNFIKSIQTQVGFNKRGPYLAEIYLENRLLKNANNNTNDVVKLQDLLVNYFKLFSDKIICYSDIKAYLSLFLNNSLDSRIKFCSQLENIIQAELSKSPVIGHIWGNYYSIAYDLGIYDSLDLNGTLELVNKILTVYYDVILVESKNKEQTELSTVDNLLLFSSYLLSKYITNNSTIDITLIIQIISLLELGVSYSKFNFQFKFMLLCLYNSLGCVYASLEVFNSLDVKHILWDTLSYLVLDDILLLADNETSTTMIEHIQQFHDENKKQTPDFVIRSYSTGSYSKIQEFMKFKSRLDRSIQLAIVTVEDKLTQLEKNSNSALEAEAFIRSYEEGITINTKDVSVNYDTTVMKWNIMLNNNNNNSNIIFSTASNNIPLTTQLSYLQLRLAIPSALKDLYNQRQVSNLDSFHSQLKNLDLPNFMNKIYSTLLSSLEINNQLVPLIPLLEKGEGFEDSLENNVFTQIKQHLSTISKNIKEMGEETLSEIELLSVKVWTRIGLSKLSMLTRDELYWSLLVYDALLKSLPPLKKKKPNVILTNLRILLRDAVSVIKDTLIDIQSRIKQLIVLVENKGLITFSNSNLIKILSNENSQHVTIASNKIVSSYSRTLSSLIKQLEKRLNFIQTIRM